MKKLTLFLVAITMNLFSLAQSQMSGTYTVGTGGSYDYSSMADAGMAIKAAEFTGDVTLLICTDLTETINTGIVNKSEYTLTIRPDKDENRTITYTTATDNTGPTGVFVIGGDMTMTPGSTIGWASVPTKNVIVDGAAEGKTTPRLKITTAAWGTNFLLYGDVQDCVVKNCILENTGTASANYALTFRSEKYSSTSKNIGPKNCVVENCILEATHASKSQTIYFNGSQANSAAGYPANITIRNCSIKAHTRGMFLYGVNGLNVEGCTFDLSDMASGLMCHGIFGNKVAGTINVKGNKFIKNSTKNTYAGEYGLQTITASGGATVWVIENNYFAGFDALASGTTSKESRLLGIRCGDPCEVRHNTFYMPKLTYAPGTSLVGTHAVALLWLAGSHKYPVQNNIFVCEETAANVSLIRGGLNENVTGNVFYHKGGNAAIVAAAPSCMTFADLETSYPTQAATSKWANVTFADAANGDLSLAGSSDRDLNLAVDRLAEVLTDINGTARREKTYAGAYEGSEFPAEVCSVTTTVVPVDGGTVEGDGDYAKGASVTLTATSNDHYDFVNWTEDGAVVSTTAEYSFTVTKDIELTANFQEHTKYTITAVPNDENMGTVTGGNTYYVGESATLKATAKLGYVFAGWADGEKNATRIVEVSADATYTANFQAIAPRAWAYDLKVAENGDNYEFTFNATAAGSATLLFADIDGNELVAAHAVGTVAAGAKTVTLAKTTFEGVTKDVYWSVKMDGEAIPAISEITDASEGIYNFYLPQGVAVDNNPESSTFSKIYIAESTDGASDGGSDRADNQKRGIFIYDQTLAELNPTNKGIIPSNVTLTNTTRNALKRIAINPKTNEVAFAYNASPAAVWAVSTENVAGEATNLLEGLGFEYCNSLCFDENGILYIFDNGAGYPAKGSLYKIVNGEKITIFSENSKYGNADNSLASDGRGGLWIYQNRGQLDAFNQLSHINATGEIDFEVNSTTPHDFASLNTSRGAMAYNPRENILAIGIGASGTIGVSLYQVTYDPSTDVPSLEYIGATPSLGKNVDGIAFDYAGDLYALSTNAERFYKFTLPTDENICTVPAPSSQKLVLGTQCEVTVTVNASAMGSVEGAGIYEKGTEVTLTPNPVAHHRFVNWTGDMTSTDNPLKFTIEGNVTLTANFEPIPQYTISVTYDNTMGTVTGDGTYYEGEEVTLTAKANAGHVFVKWSDEVTDESRTFTATENVNLEAIFAKASPRAWAYDLRLDSVADPANYTFTFTATSAGNATIFFTDEEGTSVAPTQEVVGAVAAGETKTVTIAKSAFTGDKDIYWSVKVEGEAIAKMAELTDPTEGIYNFYVPQGVAVDNSPNSMYFGRIYVAEGTTGGNDGLTEMAKQITAGLFVYNQALEKVQPATGYTGIIPQNVTFDTNKPTSTDEINIIRQQMHRVAVDPVTGEVAFAYYKSPATAIYSMNPDDLAGNAQNLIEGSSITYANSLCFDSEGTLYVMNNANTGLTGGQIYKVQDDEVTLFAAHDKNNQWAVYDNAMASDGRGGLWIAQNRYAYDYPILSHVNKDGVVDFAVKENLNGWFPNNNTGSSYRGQVAYNEKEDVLAFGGNKVAALFKVTYDANGKPTITEKLMTTPELGTNIDGVAFDYAGDLYVASATAERFYKYVLPTNNNTCTVPAPESQAIQKEPRYTVTVEANDNALGTVSGGGEYKAGKIAKLTATATNGYRFANWTKEGEVLSDNASFSYTVTAEDVTIIANFSALPAITYELNGGVWNKYGWTSKKDMYNALLDDWRAYSGSARTNVTYETQLGIGNSSKGIPTTIYTTEGREQLLALLLTDATYAPKWGWLATYVDAVAAAQSKTTQPTTAAGNLTYTIGNFFGEDNMHANDWMGAVDFTGEEAHITEFAPYWGQTFPMPTQPTEEIVLNAPYKEGYEFDGWYANSDFSGEEITIVDENTNGTLYAKWLEHRYTRTVTNGNFGTICLPYGSNNYSGAEFYEISYLQLKDDGVTPMGIWLDEAPFELVAGKPYIFKATSNLLTVNYKGEEALSPVDGKAGLTGTFDDITDETVLQGNYMIAGNNFWLCGTGCYLNANRAYIEHDALHATTTPVSPIPGRRRVMMGAAGENTTTGVDNLTEDGVVSTNQATKMVVNGQLIIIRDGVKYNAQGVRL